MTRNTFLALAMLMTMTTANTYAQGRDNRGGRNEGRREMSVSRDGGVRMRNGSSRGSSYEGRRDMNRSEGMNRRNDMNRNEGMNRRNDMNRSEGMNHRNDMNRNEGMNRHNDMNHNEGMNHRNDNMRRDDMRGHNYGTHHNDGWRTPGRNIPEHRFSGRFDHRGHVIGWEGRVRHENGRWGYYRGNRWYWYNRYFDPTYYYATPLYSFNDYYYMTDGDYIPGYEGRVCYRGGRWGYYRDNDWYWYDRYYEPDYYYAHPVHHFHHNYIGHTLDHVAAGVVGTIALGALISALCH